MPVHVGHLKELGNNICFDMWAGIRLRSFREDVSIVHFFFFSQGKYTFLITYGDQLKKVPKICSTLEMLMILKTENVSFSSCKDFPESACANLQCWKCWWIYFLRYFCGQEKAILPSLLHLQNQLGEKTNQTTYMTLTELLKNCLFPSTNLLLRQMYLVTKRNRNSRYTFD